MDRKKEIAARAERAAERSWLIDLVVKAESTSDRLAADPERLYPMVAKCRTDENLARYRAGMLLFKRQQLLAKPGSPDGTFVKELKEFGQTYTRSQPSLYRDIRWYKLMRHEVEGLISEDLTAEQLALFGDPVDLFDDAIAADASVAEVDEILRKAAAQVEAAKGKPKPPPKVLPFVSKLDKNLAADVNAALAILTADLGSKDLYLLLAKFVISQARISSAGKKEAAVA